MLYVTRKEFAPLVEHSPFVDTVIPLDVKEGRTGLNRLREQLRGIAFDRVFDLHNNHRSRFLRNGLQGTLHIYRKEHWRWMLLVGLHLNTYKTIVPVAERYAASAGLQPDNLPPEIRIPDDITAWAEQAVPRNDAPLIALCPGAKHFTKQYPLHHLSSLCKMILDRSDAAIVLLGGRDEQAAAETLRQIAPERIRSYCGTLQLLESAAVLARCAAAISNDSGLMHMATAVGVPVVALFGSTVREFGFFPHNAKSVVLETEGLSCRPCTHIGRKSCPRNHFRCMESIEPRRVAEALFELLENRGSRTAEDDR